MSVVLDPYRDLFTEPTHCSTTELTLARFVWLYCSNSARVYPPCTNLRYVRKSSPPVSTFLNFDPIGWLPAVLNAEQSWFSEYPASIGLTRPCQKITLQH